MSRMQTKWRFRGPNKLQAHRAFIPPDFYNCIILLNAFFMPIVDPQPDMHTIMLPSQGTFDTNSYFN